MIDTTPLILSCNTPIYRALFSNKQACCWFSTSFPIEGEEPEEPFDLRRGVNPKADLKYLTYGDLRKAQSMTLLELRRNCLEARFNRA